MGETWQTLAADCVDCKIWKSAPCIHTFCGFHITEIGLEWVLFGSIVKIPACAGGCKHFIFPISGVELQTIHYSGWQQCYYVGWCRHGVQASAADTSLALALLSRDPVAARHTYTSITPASPQLH